MSDISTSETVENTKRLRQQNHDLQDALEKADMEVQDLMLDIISLQNHNKSLKKEEAWRHELLEELDELRLSLEQSKEATRVSDLARKEMERKCAKSEEAAEQLSHQLSDTLDQNKFLQNKVTSLRSLNTELESGLQNLELELKQKEEIFHKKEEALEQMTLTMKEYSSIIEVLHNKVKTLQGLLNKTQQEIAMNKTKNQPPAPARNGTLMYEMVQAELEKELLQTHYEKERRRLRGFLGMRRVQHSNKDVVTSSDPPLLVLFQGFLLHKFLPPLHSVHTPAHPDP
ncbi:uncharacterized protein O3C94_012135 isoform 2-T3 [Discoglossus pictus]